MNLNALYWLKKEIRQIERQIEELTVLSAISMNGMPSGNTVSSSVEKFYERLEQLREKLQRKRAELLTETERIETYIESIDDAEIRVMARNRFIENKTYQVIGDEMYMDGTTVRKKLKRYFERTDTNGKQRSEERI